MSPTEMGVRTTPVEPDYTVYAADDNGDTAASTNDVNDVIALLLARIERLEYEVAAHVHEQNPGGITSKARRRYKANDPLPARSGETMRWSYADGSVLPL